MQRGRTLSEFALNFCRVQCQLYMAVIKPHVQLRSVSAVLSGLCWIPAA